LRILSALAGPEPENLDLSDEEAAALVNKLTAIVKNDRHPLSMRIRTLKAILAKMRPEPVREPLPPSPKLCATAADREAETARAGR